MERLICIDDTLPDMVIGCDPGPERCALVRIQRCGDQLFLAPGDSIAYPTWQELADFQSGWRPPFPAMPNMPFCFAFEKVTSRYGATPGATTFDTCRNSGVVLSAMIRAGARAAYALGTVDWRVALGGHSNLRDSEVRARLVCVLGEDGDREISAVAKGLKKLYNLPKPIGCHLRDAAGVAIGAYLMQRRGTPVSAREVWRHE